MQNHVLVKSIREAANEVLSTLGHGFSEAVYEKALVVELENRGLKCMEQLIIPYTYEGITVGNGRIDLLVEQTICVELKIETASCNSCRLINDAMDQIWCYLRFMPDTISGFVVVFPKRPNNRCMCVEVQKGKIIPYVTGDRLYSITQ